MSSESGDERIPKEIENVDRIDLITNRSACSVIFKVTLQGGRRPICMKVTFIHSSSSLSSAPRFIYTSNSCKFTITETEANENQRIQHELYSTLHEFNKEIHFIPEAYGSYTVSPSDFKKYFTDKPSAQDEINLIYEKAVSNNLNLNIAFMEFLDGFRGYNSDTDTNITPYIVAANLAVLIITGRDSLDKHVDNVQISETSDDIKLLDWDRSITIDEAGLYKILNWVDLLLARDHPKLFFTVCRYFPYTELEPLIKQVTNEVTWNSIKVEVTHKLKENFSVYYRMLHDRLNYLKTNWNSLSKERKRYDIFDLLTFVGFMDCLSKEAKNMGTTMQCSPFIYNLFKDVGLSECISLDDMLPFRQTYLDKLKQSSEKSKDESNLVIVKKALDGIIEVLDALLTPPPHLGTGGRAGWLKRNNRIKKQHRSKNGRKSIKKIRHSRRRRSKTRKRNTRN